MGSQIRPKMFHFLLGQTVGLIHRRHDTNCALEQLCAGMVALFSDPAKGCDPTNIG